MRRIMVFGGPGAGKSRFAQRAAVRLGVPVIHIDQLFWLPGWQQRPREDFAARVARAVAADGWVFDGNNTGTFALRADRADLMVFLDPPRRVRLWRVVRRAVLGLGQVRPDMAPGCPERIDRGFWLWAWRWDRDHRPAMLDLARARGGHPPLVRLSGRAEEAPFLDSLTP
jgi:adenylate kinase family enzyme